VTKANEDRMQALITFVGAVLILGGLAGTYWHLVPPAADPLTAIREKCNADARADVAHYDQLLQATGKTGQGVTGADLQKTAVDLCVSMEIEKANKR
jgi:hypothetical protein